MTTLNEVLAVQESEGGVRAPSDEIPSEMSIDEIRASIDASGIPKKAAIDASFGSNFGKWYETIPSISKNAMQYSMAKDPERFKVLKFRDAAGRFDPHTVTPAEEYGTDFVRLSEEERGKRIKEVDDTKIRESYANAGNNPWGAVAGAVVGAVADPTSVVIPGGGSLKAAVGIGAAFGATDMALESKLREGEIDGSDVALGTAFGGVAGGMIYLGGKAMSSFLTDHITSKIPVKGEDVRSRLKEAGVSDEDMPDIDPFVQEFNEALDLGRPQSIAKVKEAVRLQGKSIPIESPEQLHSSVLSMLDRYGDELSPKERTFLQKAEKLYKSLSEGTKYKAKAHVTKSGKIRLGAGEKPFLAAYERTLREADEHVTSVYDDAVRRVDDVLSDDPSVTDQVVSDLGPSSQVTGRDKKETARRAIASGEINIDSKVGRSVEPPIGRLSDEMTDQKAADTVNLTAIDSALSTPRAVLQQKMGAAGGELAGAIQRHQELVNWDVANAFTDFKKSLSKAGWYSLPRVRDKEIGTQVTDILRRDLDPKNADPIAVKVANDLKGQLEGVVDQMVNRGVISKIQGAALKHSSRKEGWAPRVMDQEYLGTRKGEKHFKEVLANAKLTQKEAESIAKKYSGKTGDLAAKGVIKNKDGTYRLSSGLVSRLFKQRMTQGKRAISSHIEKERTLNLPDRVLKPFLKNDIRDIMESYFYDVYRGSRAAQVFGKEGEDAARMLNSIHEQYGDEAYKFAANTYSLHSRVEVAGAERLQVFLNQPEWQRRTVHWMRGAMTPLLYTAQLLNLTQATVNGFIALAGRQGIPKALASVYRGIGKTFTQEGRDFADRTGAAVQTQILQIVNSQGDIPNKFSSWVLKWTQFQMIEELQRNVAANIGKTYIEDLLEKRGRLMAQELSRGTSTAQKRQLNKVNSQLEEMGIMPGKDVTVADVQLGAQRFSNATNFTTGADQLPLAWQSPFMSLVRQFKSFAFLQGKFLKDQIVTPMKKGNFGQAASALAALGLAPLAAGGIPAFVSEIRKKWYTGEWSESKLEVALGAYTSIGGLGLIFDTALRTTGTTPERFLSGLAGPSITAGTKLATGLGSTVASPFDEEGFTTEPLIRSVLKTIPGGHKIREYTLDRDSDIGYKSVYKGMEGSR